ncbi:MAG: bifunctional oligoribonuclease/PAP phosphatase NrnA [bacterium]
MNEIEQKNRRAEEQKKLEEVIKIINERDNFIITSHIRPDGDSLGSQISLFLILKGLGKRVIIINEDNPPAHFSFLPHLSEILQPDDNRKDVALILDVNEIERLGIRTKKIIERIPLKINIDHHLGGAIGNISWMDENASSVCEMIYRLIKAFSIQHSGFRMNKDIALLLYVGIATDTGFFSFRNTTPSALRICASLLEYGIEPSKIKEELYSTKTLNELRLFGKALSNLKMNGSIVSARITEEMIEEANREPETGTLLDLMRGIKDSRVILLFRELSPSRTKVSLRSKEGFDVRSIAALFGGGGHLCAAGCILPLPIEEAEEKIMSCLKASYMFA